MLFDRQMRKNFHLPTQTKIESAPRKKAQCSNVGETKNLSLPKPPSLSNPMFQVILAT